MSNKSFSLKPEEKYIKIKQLERIPFTFIADGQNWALVDGVKIPLNEFLSGGFDDIIPFE